ncbi:hypothetical protein C8R44DRAFT_865012 [Mycena epipterygia]|nr:hypothetical protein C8R44DRAFT_865012 [Mycena epipterygia]
MALAPSNKILEHASIMLMDPSIPAYRDEKIGLNKLLMDVVLLNGASWGFTVEMQADQEQLKAVKEEISSILTTKRNVIQTTICGSLGSDPIEPAVLRPDDINIVDLAQLLGSKQKATVKVGTKVCGRIALLCKSIGDVKDHTYWTTVDSELVKLRLKYPIATDMSRYNFTS